MPLFASRRAFSLLEVTVALGLCAFCLTGLLYLLPVSLKSNYATRSESEAVNLLSMVSADLRLSLSCARPVTAQYAIPTDRSSTLDLDNRHRLTVTLLDPVYPKLWLAMLEIRWAGGSVQTFFAANLP